MRCVKLIAAAFVCMALALSCKAPAPEPYGTLPSDYQVEWQKMEMNMFCHFGPNTFSGKEWGDGTEPEDMFAPTALNCAQWAATAKAAGLKGIIITAKHHDGFCLWPNPESVHTVAQSSWRDGKGDVLQELSAACREAGLGFGVYVSPWDRNAPNYGTPDYNNTFLRTLESVLNRYGTVFEQWFDGANGEGPNGRRQVYDWPAFNAKVSALQPRAVIFSDCGPGCRWIGNERGEAGRACWSTFDPKGLEPGSSIPSDTLGQGMMNGPAWIPGEADVSIRPGWFYKESEHPKSLNELLGIYYSSVGRNALLLLNVPPDQRGLICAEDSVRLMEFNAALNTIFSRDLAQGASIKAEKGRGVGYEAKRMLNDDYDSYWAAKDGVSSCAITLLLPEERSFNRILLQEYIPLGQRVAEFSVEVLADDGSWREVAHETTIGYKRIVLTEMVSSSQVRIRILKSLACPVISKIALYRDDIYKQ